MIRVLVFVIIFVINGVYKKRPYPRLYVLETIAREFYEAGRTAHFCKLQQFFASRRDFTEIAACSLGGN